MWRFLIVLFVIVAVSCSKYNIKKSETWNYYSFAGHNSDGAKFHRLHIYFDTIFHVDHQFDTLRYEDHGTVTKYKDSVVFHSHYEGNSFIIDTLFNVYTTYSKEILHDDSTNQLIDTSKITVKNKSGMTLRNIQVFKDKKLAFNIDSLTSGSKTNMKLPINDFSNSHIFTIKINRKSFELNFAHGIECEINIDTTRIIGPIFRNAKLNRKFMKYYKTTGKEIISEGVPTRKP